MTATQALTDQKGKKPPKISKPRKLSKKEIKTAEASVAKNGAPEELSGLALAIWNALAPGLRNLNFLRDSDHVAFARYCMHAAKWWQLTEKVEKEGDTYWSDSNHGKLLRANPAYLIREREEKHLIALEDRFGMNPAYRQQILQRMAGLTPPVPGELFDRQNGQTDDTDGIDTNAEIPSAVGILATGSTSVN